MATLYALTEEWQEVLDMSEDADVPQAEIDERLDAIAGDIRAKANGYALIISQLTADAEMLKNEEARLKRRRQAAERSVRRLKEGLLGAMQTVGTPKIKTDLFTISVRRNPEKLEVDESTFLAWAEENAPELIKVTRAADNTAVRSAIKAGQDVPGARLAASDGIAIR